MTGPEPGAPERGTGAPPRSTGTQGAVGAVLIILALGLALRFILLYLLPGSGFDADLASFRFWADDLARNGLGGFYERDFFHDYTPGYMYVLWVVGTIGRAVGGIGDLIKIPPILADLGLGYLVWSMVRELGGRERLALVGAFVVMVNPIFWFDSVVWGQVDSVGVVFLLLGLRSLWRDQPERAAIFTVIAAIVKPQLGILVPIVAVVTIRRALRPVPEASEGEADGLPVAQPATSRFAAWESRTGHPLRILTTGLAGYLTALVACLPFGLTVLELTPAAPFLASGLVEQIAVAGGGYPYLTVNAFNAWAIVQGDLGISLANGGQWVCDTTAIAGDRCGAGVAQFGAVPAVVAGAVLLVLAILSALWAVWRRPDRLTILVALAVLAIAFFAAPTRVHERYGFPFFALGAILFAISPRWRVAYVVLGIATFANMYVVLTTMYPPKDPSLNPIRDWLTIGPLLRTELGVVVVSLLHTLGFAWAWLQLRPSAQRRLDAESAAASAAASIVATAPAVVPDRPRPAIGRAGLVERTPPAATLPTWSEPDRFDEIGVRSWIADRVSATPLRADRTRTLRTERGGRLDRLDVWLLVLVILSTLGIRLFRLAEPYQMHFDEVYHARTATEFLQAWRYGDSHSIYEWTHPHLAKYAMAGGLVLWGGDHVESTGDLGDPVRAAVIEHRRDDPGIGRTGERLHIATGEVVRTEDLRTRQTVGRFDAPGVGALAIDPSQPRLVLGDDDGAISRVDLDLIEPDGQVSPIQLTTVDHPIEHLLVTDEGTILAASDLDVTAVDGETGQVLGTAEFTGIADLATAGSGEVVRGDPALIDDPAAVADVLAALLGGDALDYESRIANAEPDTMVVFGGAGDEESREAIDAAITDGRLAGLEIVDQPRAAVATSEGVSFIDPSSTNTSSTLPMDGGAHGIGLVTGLDATKLYVATGSASDPEYHVVVVSGDDAADGPVDKGSHPLPGLGSRVAYDAASQHVHILGRSPADTGWTVYVIEPHADAVYADAALPSAFEPVALVMDAEPEYQADDRQKLLALDASGVTASIDVGSHAFAWRLPGVIAGVLMAVCLYLLARILFERRSIAIAVGGLAVVEGMFFVQSRIGMNDAYVGLFIVAAYTVFAALWTGWWRGRGAFWVGMPLIGLLLGLALASKWVAAYAIGALALLLLVRSALGRVVAILGLIAISGVLGYMAMAVPAGQGFGNVPFLVIMIGLTLLAVIVAIFHPIAWTDEEMWLALLAPTALGAVLFFGALTLGRLDQPVVLGPVSVTPLLAAIAAALSSVVVYLAFRFGGLLGYGPLKVPPPPDDPQRYLDPPEPAPTGWLRPGWLLGVPLVWTAVCLVAIPLGVYVVSYLPWTGIENHRLWDGFPAEHSGQTLLELTRSMYDYHNGLTSPHPASSPWWAFPFDLKPVWFYQEGFAGGTSAAIYDSGNLVIWWLGIVGLVFVSIMAYRRRSPALALIAIGFAAQWVPWARIERAAFQYHYYTALPFVVLALAYLIAELWHGPSRRTWAWVRLAGALAIVAPAAMWLFSRPLCWLVGVGIINPSSQACPAVIPDFLLTYRTAALLVVVAVGAVVLGRGISALQGAAGAEDGSRRGPMRSLLLGAGFIAVALAVASLVPDTPIFTWRGIPVEPIALLVTLPLLYLAGQVIAARDARRFVLGLGVAAAAWFVVWYPNLAALPLPSTVVNAYQGFLPTYLYAFQFPVNTTPRSGVSLVSPELLLLTAAIAATCLIVAYSASVWRLVLAGSRASAASGGGPGSASARGPDEERSGLARTGGGA